MFSIVSYTRIIKLSYTLLVCGLLNCSNNATTPLPPAVSNFEKTFESTPLSDLEDLALSIDVLETQQGNYLLSGTSRKINQQKYGFVVKVDSAGEEIWRNTEIVPADIVTVHERTDGSYLLGTADWGRPIICLDKDGNELWHNNITMLLDAFPPYHILENNDGSIYALLNVQFQRPRLAKVAANGDVIWIKEVGPDSTINISMHLELMENGDPRVLHFTGSDPFTPRPEMLFIEFNSDGVETNRIPLDRSFRVFPNTLFNIFSKNTTGSIAGCIADSLYIISRDGKVTATYLSPLPEYQSSIGLSTVKLESQSFLVGGVLRGFRNSSSTNAALWAYDMNGNLQWTEIVDRIDNKDNAIYALRKGTNNSILVAGTQNIINDTGAGTAWFFKVKVLNN